MNLLDCMAARLYSHSQSSKTKTVNSWCGPCVCRKQDSWVREQVKLNKSSDPLWQHAGFIVAQMDGLQAGARDWAKKQGKKVSRLQNINFILQENVKLCLCSHFCVPKYNCKHYNFPKFKVRCPEFKMRNLHYRPNMWSYIIFCHSKTSRDMWSCVLCPCWKEAKKIMTISKPLTISHEHIISCCSLSLTKNSLVLFVFILGLTAVYLLSFPQPLSLFDIQFLNAVGDLLDLIPALMPSSNPPLRDFKLPGMGHCSALIKVRGQEMTLSGWKAW